MFESISCTFERCQCEAPRDELIRQPSSFWSSVFYLIAAYFLYQFIKVKSKHLRLWIFACSAMGFSSLFAHGSFTKIGLALDFSSIVLILSFFPIINLLLKSQRAYFWMIFSLVVYYLCLFFAMYTLNKWGQIAISATAFAFSLLDVSSHMKEKELNNRALYLSLAIFALSFIFFVLDEMHVACDPYSLFQLHSLWHLGTAVSLYFYGIWRFKLREPIKN